MRLCARARSRTFGLAGPFECPGRRSRAFSMAKNKPTRRPTRRVGSPSPVVTAEMKSSYRGEQAGLIHGYRPVELRFVSMDAEADCLRAKFRVELKGSEFPAYVRLDPYGPLVDIQTPDAAPGSTGDRGLDKLLEQSAQEELAR